MPAHFVTPYRECSVFHPMNRFHGAMLLCSNRSQMTSKCGKNKKIGREDPANGVSDVLITFCHLLWFLTKLSQGTMKSTRFIK